MDGFDKAIQIFLDDMRKTFIDCQKSVASSSSPPLPYDASDVSSVTSSPCYISDDSSWSGESTHDEVLDGLMATFKQVGNQNDSPNQSVGVSAVKTLIDPRLVAREANNCKHSAVTTSRDPRLTHGSHINHMLTNDKKGNLGVDEVSVTNNNSTPAVDHVSTKPVANKAKGFKLPDIKFNGNVYFRKQTSLDIPPAIVFKEGELVDEFLKDFETEVMCANLNIERCWYDLLEDCFKEARPTRMNLYLWFKKRLHEGLSWGNARLLIRSEFGFAHPDAVKIFPGLAENPNKFLRNECTPSPHSSLSTITDNQEAPYKVPLSWTAAEEYFKSLDRVTKPKIGAQAKQFSGGNDDIHIARIKNPEDKISKQINEVTMSVSKKKRDNKKVFKKLNIKKGPNYVKPKIALALNKHTYF